ncbi:MULTISPECIES: DUF805 domain-containing protein [Vibrio]|uniref:DUF805 domain-containing protein n=1 Tax=Vibrio casei TaxID=673372 RepID=A0A368LIG9_9VIBR|nr:MULTISPECIES: DUF805 domain-containing protein [Vibrio]RCS70426.1 DUF805 domain-containing protein [Vibrio casei]SJN20858.1 Integral membrane protein [Vibrio casei]HBV77022.1 DUF805 domain-containing protein [Vibrio sp.]
MSWYLEVLRKYATFSGRARRKEYWYFILVSLVITFILSFVDVMLGLHSDKYDTGVFQSIYALAILIPSIAVAVRRLHDTNRSGWWLLIGFVPFVGVFVLLYFFVCDGPRINNRFGASPKMGFNV